jgi:hypothetical protein
MAKNRLVLTDIPLDDPLSRYFDFKNIEYDRLPTEHDVPLVDIIDHRSKGKADVILILGLVKNGRSNGNSSMEQLFKQVSVYNDFRRLRQRVTLIVYAESDILVRLNSMRKINFEYYSWFRDLKPLILTDGVVGQNLRNDYNDCEFVELSMPHLHPNLIYPELGIVKNHKPTTDYLCLMADWPDRPFRHLLNEKILANGIHDNMIYSFKKKNRETFDDLRNHFNESVLDNLGWMDGFPSIDLYNQTNLELAPETLCEDHDDTFFMTEKTIKPIAMKHPFMVLANKNFLKNLRGLGFKTFHEHLDESYDSEPMIEKRVDILMKNLIQHKNQTHKIYKDTKQIRDHNHLNLQHQAGEYWTKLFKTIDDILRNI